MDLKNNFYILFAALLFLSSCISTYDLMESHSTDVARFSTTGFNGNYSNSSDSTYRKLWNTLYSCKSFNNDQSPISKNAIVNIRFESDKRLIATAIENDTHLVKCLTYIDMNMVRTGVVQHPSEWNWSGYNEIQNQKQRYAIINYGRLVEPLRKKHQSANLYWR